MSLEAVASLVGGELEGDPERRVVTVAEPEDAGPADAAFFADARRLALLPECAAGVMFVPVAAEIPSRQGQALIRVPHPTLAMAMLLDALYPLEVQAPGVDATAIVGVGVEIGDGVVVGSRVVLEDGVRVGRGSEIGAGCVIGPGVKLGCDCVLHPNVTIYDGCEIGDRVILHAGVVLGADGFGYASDGTQQVKVPQVGGVLVEDDVEIGANSCVDRGTFRRTRIGTGTKIDNLVQVGHNCDVGRHCTLCGLVGLAGSTILEDGVIAGGNVGTAGHQRIGAGSMLAAKSGVHGDVAAGSIVGGYPHMEIGLWRRVVGSLAKLPELLRRVRRLERAVERLEKE